MITRIIIRFNNGIQFFLSELMKFYLRLNGAQIGKNTFVSISSRIVGKKIIIGNDSRILSRVKIKAKSIELGQRCIISDDVFISGKGNISIGSKSYLGKKSRIDLSRDVSIGFDVGFGENSIIWTHGYYPPVDEGYPVTYGGVTIKDKAWVSTNIIILPNVTIGESCIIGAGSVITKSIDDRLVVAGNPGKPIKKVDDILKPIEFNKLFENLIGDFLENKSFTIEKYDDFTLIKFGKSDVYISDSFELLPKSILNKNSIVISKNIDKNKLIQNNILFFDLQDKICLRTKNEFFNELETHFQAYGMRFLKID
jgi:acetyltransferase-like isoleucine patch superfamily enzyme